MAVWRRKPKDKMLIQSDQGSQFTNLDRASCLKAQNLEYSMSDAGIVTKTLLQRAISICSSEQSNGQSKANAAAVSNARALKRYAMNDTFSEDAWRKLNTMKL